MCLDENLYIYIYRERERERSTPYSIFPLLFYIQYPKSLYVHSFSTISTIILFFFFLFTILKQSSISLKNLMSFVSLRYI